MADEHMDSTAKLMDAIDSLGKRMDARMDAHEKRLDAMGTKMDSFEKEKVDAAKKDAEEKAKMDAEREKDCMDAAKKDAEEKAKKDAAEAEEKAKKDAAIADALADLQRRVPVELAETDRARLTSAQLKAERVHQAFGDSAGAPRWLNGEDERAYRRRLVSKFQTHSTRFKDIDLAKIGDDAAFTLIEDGIYADAYTAAVSPTNSGDDLRMSSERDQAGRQINRFYGSERAAWRLFCNPDNVGRINTRFDH